MKPNKIASSVRPVYASAASPNQGVKAQGIPAAEVGELPCKIHYLHSEIGYLENVCHDLIEQLQPVVRCMPPNGLEGNQSTDPQPLLAPLSNEVESAATRILRLRNHLAGLKEALAL